MLKSRFIIGLFFCVLASAPLYAATVSFLVMEIGQSKIESGVQSPALWENNLLDIFFESGHIVSNAPIVRLGEKPSNGFPDEAEKDYENAQKGGMGYFMIAIVDYMRSDVSLRLFSTGSRTMLREHRYAVKAFRNTKDEQDNIKAAIRTMAAQMH
jgi:hypothetical protein